MAAERDASLRTVVLVSPQFPPSPLAATHRVRLMAKHLPAFGWRPIVMRVDERHYVERLDPELAQLVPDDIEQVRVNALPAGLTRGLGIGDLGLRAYPYFARALNQFALRRRPAVVFFTGFPFYPFLLAPGVKRHRIPVVLDFQDPWVSTYGATRPRWSKEGLAHRLAVSLEPKALRAADYVTGVSEVQNAEMAARYPWLDPGRMAAIPIGGDPGDFAAARTASGLQRGGAKDAPINLSYVGAFWPRAEPTFRCLFRAAAKLRQREPQFAARLRLNFYGTWSRSAGAAVPQVLALAEAEGVGDMAREFPERLPFLEALAVLTQSHGLLLLGSDEPHYTASKIYPALMSGRPFLSLFHGGSSAHTVLAAAGGGRTLAFGTADELSGLETELCEGLRMLAIAPDSFGRADPAIYEPYTARAVAGRFAEIFDLVSGLGASAGASSRGRVCEPGLMR
jgi:hypothetical protein